MQFFFIDKIIQEEDNMWNIVEKRSSLVALHPCEAKGESLVYL
jgi:hypothetical protein